MLQFLKIKKIKEIIFGRNKIINKNKIIILLEKLRISKKVFYFYVDCLNDKSALFIKNELKSKAKCYYFIIFKD